MHAIILSPFGLLNVAALVIISFGFCSSSDKNDSSKIPSKLKSLAVPSLEVVTNQRSLWSGAFFE